MHFFRGFSDIWLITWGVARLMTVVENLQRLNSKCYFQTSFSAVIMLCEQ